MVIDGSHNPEGCRALARTLREELPPAGWTLVFGAFRDKDIPAMLAPFEGLADKVIATAADHERAADPAGIVRTAEQVLPGLPVTFVERVPEAVELALEWTGAGGAAAVAGSLYVSGEARSVFFPR